MSKHDTFVKGQLVQFQDRTFTWRNGEVQCVDGAQIHVLYADSVQRAKRVVVLPPKRVRVAK